MAAVKGTTFLFQQDNASVHTVNFIKKKQTTCLNNTIQHFVLFSLYRNHLSSPHAYGHSVFQGYRTQRAAICRNHAELFFCRHLEDTLTRCEQTTEGIPEKRKTTYGAIAFKSCRGLLQIPSYLKTLFLSLWCSTGPHNVLGLTHWPLLKSLEAGALILTPCQQVECHSSSPVHMQGGLSLMNSALQQLLQRNMNAALFEVSHHSNTDMLYTDHTLS